MNKKTRKKMLNKIKKQAEIEKIALDVTQQNQPTANINMPLAQQQAHEIFIKLLDSLDIEGIIEEEIMKIN